MDVRKIFPITLVLTSLMLQSSSDALSDEALCVKPFGWHWGEVHPRACSAFGCATVGDEVVTIGGTYWTTGDGPPEKRYLSEAWSFSGTRGWTPLPSFPLTVGQVMAASVGTKIIAVGGTDGKRAFGETRWLDLENLAGGWQIGPPLPAPLFALVGGVWNDTVYVLTDPHAILEGQPSNGPPSSVLSWRPSADSQEWTNVAQAPDPDVGYRSAAVVAGKLVLFGGATSTTSDSLALKDTVWILDLASRRWSRGQNLPVPLRDSSALALDGRHILVAGGVEEAASAGSAPGKGRIHLSHRCLVYDSVDDRFGAAESLQLAVADNGLTKCGSRIFVIAGEDSPYRTRTDLVAVGTWPEDEER